MTDRAATADPWTLYWQADHLHSCVSSPEDARQLADYWVRFAGTLPKGARLIDLATGNGAVPFALVRAGLELDVTGVDRARIDPKRYVKAAECLQGVRFIGGVDLREAPALSDSYDAVTSQFGLEYLPAGARAAIVARLLRPGGRFQFLMHHAASAVVTPARRDLEELSVLLEPGGLMQTLAGFADGNVSAPSLASAAREYVARPEPKTRRLSGQALTALETIVTAHASGSEACFGMASETLRRVQAEHTRLHQLTQAALSEAGAASLAADLGAAGLTVDRLELFHIADRRGNGALVGWHLAGHDGAVSSARKTA